jgi:surfeit locus 1 family protein
VSQRRSLLWPSVFSLLMFVLLLSLGTWQVERLHWKEGLIAQRAAGVAAPPIEVPRTLDQARALEFRHVILHGAFRNDGELYLNAISRDGKPGYHVLTPFRLDDGRFILVDRGFVPEARKMPASRAGGQIEGETTVTGLLRVPADFKPSWFLPDNQPDRNRWFYLDLPAVAATDRVPLLPFYVAADAAPNPGGFPIGGQTNLELPNDHLQYAVTWYALAALMPVLYVMFVRLHRREKIR